MTHFVFIIAIILFSAYAILLLVPAFVFAFSKKKKENSFIPATFISVIVPVRNEEEHILACLESLAALDYPSSLMEIILVNDHSDDKTKKIAEEFSEKNPLLRVLDNLPGSAGKKAALALGVKEAKGELIATTDGDCILPVKWLKEIAEVYEKKNAVFIAGPVKYKKQQGIFRDLLQIEQVVLQVISGGAMMMGFPMMCSGANLAYRKDFFSASGGYENDAFVSGDDMMLMLKAQKSFPGRLHFMDNKEAIVETASAKNLTEAISQRTRWISKFSAYRSFVVSGTGIVVFMANFFILFSGLISLWKPEIFPLFLWSISGKMLIDLLLLSLAVPFFREPRLLLLAPPGEVIYPFLVILSAGASLSGNFSWKGRKWKN